MTLLPEWRKRCIERGFPLPPDDAEMHEHGCFDWPKIPDQRSAETPPSFRWRFVSRDEPYQVCRFHGYEWHPRRGRTAGGYYGIVNTERRDELAKLLLPLKGETA